MRTITVLLTILLGLVLTGWAGCAKRPPAAAKKVRGGEPVAGGLPLLTVGAGTADPLAVAGGNVLSSRSERPGGEGVDIVPGRESAAEPALPAALVSAGEGGAGGLPLLTLGADTGDHLAVVDGKALLLEGDRQVEEGRYALAACTLRRALEAGADGPALRLKLAYALYAQGLADEAVSELARGRELFPAAAFLYLPHATFLLARGELASAERELTALLTLNPGAAEGYALLGEVYYRQEDTARAWFCTLMAAALGHPGDSLQRKLLPRSPRPSQSPWREQPGELHLRRIIVPTEETGRYLLARLAAGELFEHLADETAEAGQQGLGGYVGSLPAAELDPSLSVLTQAQPFAPPLLVPAAEVWQLVQRITPYDPAYWNVLLPAAVKKTGDKPGKKSAAPGPAVFWLHAGAFSTREAAEEQLALLQRNGFAATSSLHQRGTLTRYNVIAGKYPTRAEAERQGAKLKAVGIDYYIRAAKQPVPAVRQKNGPP